MKAWTVGDPAYGIPGGFPASKATIGFPFYYRGWTGVPAGANHGLYQIVDRRVAAAMTLSGNVPGIAMYKEITSLLTNPADTFYDPTTQAVVLVRRHELLHRRLAAVDPGEGELPALQRVRRRDDVLALRPRPGRDAVQRRGHRRQRQRRRAARRSSPPPTTRRRRRRAHRRPPPPTTAPPTTPPPTTPPAGCTAPAWVSTTAYTTGMTVSEGGHKYTANYWTQGADPATHHAQYAEWTDNGVCGTASPTHRPPTTDPHADPDTDPHADSDTVGIVHRLGSGLGREPRVHRRDAGHLRRPHVQVPAGTHVAGRLGAVDHAGSLATDQLSDTAR